MTINTTDVFKVAIPPCIFRRQRFTAHATNIPLPSLKFNQERHHGRVLTYGAEGLQIEIGTGPEISCYVCCALGQGSFTLICSTLPQ